jgi:hypothetical protein
VTPCTPLRYACFFLFACSAYPATLKTVSVNPSKMSVNFYHTTRRHMQENITLLGIFPLSTLAKLEPWPSVEDSARVVWNWFGNNNINAKQGRQPCAQPPPPPTWRTSSLYSHLPASGWPIYIICYRGFISKIVSLLFPILRLLVPSLLSLNTPFILHFLIFYLTTPLAAPTMCRLITGWLINNELERMRKEAMVV